MKIDISNHPIVWLRDHSTDDHHDDDADRQHLLELLAMGERFVLVAERMPTLVDLADAAPQEKKARAQMLKSLRSDITHLCAGAVVVGSKSSLPITLRKALEGLMTALGVPLVFAGSEEAALRLAAELLERGRGSAGVLKS